MKLSYRLIALVVVAISEPALALDRGLPAQRFGPVTAPALTLQGPGSTGDVSGMSVKPSGGTTTNTLSVLLGRTVYVTDFMPLGSTDITTALGLAETKLGGGGRILIPPSSTCYTITAKHQIPQSVSIERAGASGRSGTVCISSNFDGDVFAIGDAARTTTVADAAVRGINFRSSITRTNGSAVALYGSYNATLSDVSCDLNPYVCIGVNGGPNAFKIHIDRPFVPVAGYVGIRIGFGATDSGPADIFINEPLVSSQTRAGIEVNATGGIQHNGGDYITNDTAMLLAPGNGQRIFGLYARGTYLDTSTNAGLKIAPTGTGTVADSQFDNLWTATNGLTTGAPGVLIQGTAAAVRTLAFNGLRSFNNGGEGVRQEGGAYIDYANPQVGFNSRKTANTSSGFYFAAGVSNWSITGGRSGAGTGFSGTNPQKYGIEIAAGAGDVLGIVNVDLTGNTTGSLSNGATGANQTIIARGAPYAFNGANVGIGTSIASNKLTVSDKDRGFTDAQGGGGALQVSIGSGGATDAGMYLGVKADTYAWAQCIKPGAFYIPCYFQPNGGATVLGPASPPDDGGFVLRLSAGDVRSPYGHARNHRRTLANPARSGQQPDLDVQRHSLESLHRPVGLRSPRHSARASTRPDIWR